MTDLPLFATPAGDELDTDPGRLDGESRSFFPAAPKQFRASEFLFEKDAARTSDGDTFGALKEAIRREWNLPIDRRVSVGLRGIEGSLDGVMKVAAYPDKIDRRSQLHLRIGNAEFMSTEIENCAVINNTTF